MFGLLSFLLIGASLATAVDDQTPKPRVEVSAQIYMIDDKTSTSRRVELGDLPVVLYVFTGETLCDAREVSTERPAAAGNGWKVTFKPAFLATARGRAADPAHKDVTPIHVTWQRLWEGGES